MIDRPALSSLQRGLLFGLLVARFYGFSASYDCWKDDKDLHIDPTSVKCDMQAYYYWTGKLHAQSPETYSYSTGGKDRATAATIRKALKERPSGVPVFVYLALHTERCGTSDNRFFLPPIPIRPGDLPKPSLKRMISYTEFSELLSASSSSSPVALLTESCYNDNVMHLPFKNFVERVNGKLYLRQEETGYPQGDGSKPLVVQFAATMPNEGAAWYRSSGAVYTQAFFKESVREDPGFEHMMIRIQKSMDATFEQKESRAERRLSQQHVVYSSRMIGKDEDILLALELKPEPDEGK